MRTIYGQVIATTGRDNHGHAIPVERLRELFDQIPDPWLMCDSHDPAKPPVARSYNKQLVQIENGNWAICSDVDIFDEEYCQRFGGFSISFGTSRFTVNPDRDAEIEVTINPLLIGLEEFYEIARRSSDELQIDVKDIYQKSFDVPALIFLSFATGAIAGGFFQEVGSDLYRMLKEKIKEKGRALFDEHGLDLKCNLTFHVQHRGNDVSILVAVRSVELDLLAERGITPDAIIEHINRIAGDKDLQKVVVRVTETDPVMFIEYYTDAAGTVHRPALPGDKEGVGG